MTLTTAPPSPPAPRPLTSPARAGLNDRAFRGLTLGCGLLVLVILGFIAVSMTQKAWPAFSHDGIRFFTTTRWAPAPTCRSRSSTAPVVTAVIALALALPLSVGIALFLSDVAPRRMRRPVSSLVDLLAAVPSVVYGLWGVIVLAPWLAGLYDRVGASRRPSRCCRRCSPGRPPVGACSPPASSWP